MLKHNITTSKFSDNIIKQERNATIELLRIVSMAMVLVLHALLTSGALEYLSGINFYVYWWMEALSIVAVDIFILISGYFILDSNFKAKNVFRIAIGGVWLYSVLFTTLSFIVSGDEWTKMDIIKMIFPFYTKKFWFVNSYVLFYVLSPFLNKMINALSKKQHTYLMLILFLVFCVRGTFSLLTWTQDVSGGMSVLLFLPLYVIASWLKKYYKKDNKPIKYFLVYLILSFLLVLSKKLMLVLGISSEYTSKMYGYSSVVVVPMAVALFLGFLNIAPIKGKMGSLIIKLAKHSFSVYVIHSAMMTTVFTVILHVDHYVDNVLTGVLAVIISVVIIYVFCTVVDMIKTYCTGKITFLFRKTRIMNCYNKLMDKWSEAVN